MWRVVYTKQAQKDAKKLSSAGLRPKAEKLIEILRENPYQTPPPFEKLLGDLSGAFSRRINIQIFDDYAKRCGVIESLRDIDM